MRFAALLLAGLLPIVADCQASLSSGNGPALPHCPDLTPPAVGAFDYLGEMQLQPEVSGKLKLGILAALYENKLATDLEGELKGACTTYLTDLGAKATYPTAATACRAVLAAQSDARQRMGSTAELTVDVTPPSCGLDLAQIAQCAIDCDATQQGAKAVCEPGRLQGTCAGQCTGTCNLSSPGKCSGTCTGKCDGKTRGVCTGKCTGICDKKRVKGATCVGLCDGTCDGLSSGPCPGNCVGSCMLTAGGSCEGTCTGGCSGDVASGKCTGDVSAPKMTPECRAKCDAQLADAVACVPAPVLVRIAGATDPATAETYKKATEKDLPEIVKVIAAMNARVGPVGTEVKGVATQAQSLVKGAVTDPLAAQAILSCFQKAFVDSDGSAANLKADVSAAVAIKANALGEGTSGT